MLRPATANEASRALSRAAEEAHGMTAEQRMQVTAIVLRLHLQASKCHPTVVYWTQITTKRLKSASPHRWGTLCLCFLLSWNREILHVAYPVSTSQSESKSGAWPRLSNFSFTHLFASCARFRKFPRLSCQGSKRKHKTRHILIHSPHSSSWLVD